MTKSADSPIIVITLKHTASLSQIISLSIHKSAHHLLVHISKLITNGVVLTIVDFISALVRRAGAGNYEICHLRNNHIFPILSLLALVFHSILLLLLLQFYFGDRCANNDKTRRREGKRASTRGICDDS